MPSSHHREDSTDPDLLDQEAAVIGLTFNPVSPTFLTFEPSAFLRPFDARDIRTEEQFFMLPSDIVRNASISAYVKIEPIVPLID